MGTKSKVTSSFTKTVSYYKSIAIDSMCFIYQFEDNETYAIQLATAVITNQHVFISNDERFKKIKETKTLLLDDFL